MSYLSPSTFSERRKNASCLQDFCASHTTSFLSCVANTLQCPYPNTTYHHHTTLAQAKHGCQSGLLDDLPNQAEGERAYRLRSAGQRGPTAQAQKHAGDTLDSSVIRDITKGREGDHWRRARQGRADQHGSE